MSPTVKNMPAAFPPANPPATRHTASDDYAYPWNAPRRAIGRETALNRDQLRQWQAILQCIHNLPYYLRTPFLERHRQLLSQKGAHA
ncbi:replication endonuclease, partial [Serratia nevei]